MAWDWEQVDEAAQDDTRSLRCLFDVALQAHSHLSALPRDAEAAQHTLRLTLRILQRCSSLVEAHALFSDNEELDDVSTSSLRYLLLPYFSGDVLAQSREKDKRARLMSMSLACRHYAAFLKQGRVLSYLPASLQSALAHAERQEGDGTPDPQMDRTERLRQRQEQVRLEAAIERLRAKQRPFHTDEEMDAGADEEGERDLWLSVLRHASLKAHQSSRVLLQEAELLRGMLTAASEEDDLTEEQLVAQEQARREAEQQRGEMKAQLLDIANSLSQSGRRQQLLDGVFQPDHILPTITVEQAGVLELAQAREREALEARRAAATARAQAAKSAEELEDEEVAQARAQDDWNDTHPAGYGNSKLRPCAT